MRRAGKPSFTTSAKASIGICFDVSMPHRTREELASAVASASTVSITRARSARHMAVCRCSARIGRSGMRAVLRARTARMR